LKLYLDASALVKRYVDEVGSEAIVAAMNRADSCSICRVGYVETVRAVARGGEPQDVERAERDWLGLRVIEVGLQVTERAASLSVKTGLRTLDALHLAAALTLSIEHVTFATWDARLHRVARAHGLRTLPTKLD
jgi:predicted nucleic acid-binding protein